MRIDCERYAGGVAKVSKVSGHAMSPDEGIEGPSGESSSANYLARVANRPYGGRNGSNRARGQVDERSVVPKKGMAIRVSEFKAACVVTSTRIRSDTRSTDHLTAVVEGSDKTYDTAKSAEI